MPANNLQQRIVAHIEQAGPLTFADYMRTALYDPAYGYYVNGPAKIGWEGDFYTSTDVADFFANCMGRQLRQFWAQLDEPDHFVVLEQGSGRGDLARGVQNWAAHTDERFAQALHYQTEDMNAGQDALLDSAQPTHTHPISVILSNELVDAFPVHLIQKYDNQLYEVYISSQDGRLYEVLGEPDSSAVATYLDDYQIPWRTFSDGWRAEVNLDAQLWMQRVTQRLLGQNSSLTHPGFILTIDYGEKAEQLYTPNRPHGTLSCYFQHQFNERPLARPGEQDITAHVNFSALINAAQLNGLHLHTYTTQREWLTTNGIYDELDQIRTRDFSILETARATDEGQAALFKWYNLRQRVTALTEPTGMGNFKVLILQS